VITSTDIDHRFNYHPATNEAIRAHCKAMAHVINSTVADSREKALAITKLEETMMWANAAVARHGLTDNDEAL